MLRRAWQDQSPGARSQLTPVNGYEAQDGGGFRDASGAVVDARKGPVDWDVVQRHLGGLPVDREPLLQQVDPQQHENRVRGTFRGPRRGVPGNPGDEGIPWDDGESLLGEGLPARALCGSFATVRKAHLVHATIIPGQAQPPLPFALNCAAAVD